MSTEYIIVTDGKAELCCVESSSRFSLQCWYKETYSAELQDLSAEQLVKAAIELLKVASYNMSSDEIQGVVAASRKESGYFIGVSL